MSDSKRRCIRKKVVDWLKAALASSAIGDRVFESRPEAIMDSEMPAVCIYTNMEPVIQTISGGEETVTDRELNLSVDIMASQLQGFDDQIDDISEIIEETLLDSEISYPDDGLFKTIELKKTEIGFLEGGRLPIAAARMSFVIDYEKII